MIKKAQLPDGWQAMSGLNVNEPIFSSMLTLRAELKEIKCEIR